MKFENSQFGIWLTIDPFGSLLGVESKKQVAS